MPSEQNLPQVIRDNRSGMRSSHTFAPKDKNPEQLEQIQTKRREDDQVNFETHSEAGLITSAERVVPEEQQL